MNRLEEIEKRLEAMPEGPYSVSGSDRLTAAGVLSKDGTLTAICGGRHRGMDEDRNARFYAAAPADLQDLLAVARAAAALGDELGATVPISRRTKTQQALLLALAPLLREVGS